MSKRNDEQFALISKYFDLKDCFDKTIKKIDGIEVTYNVELSPKPPAFSKLQVYFSENNFGELSDKNLSNEEVQEKSARLEDVGNELDNLINRLDYLEVYLRKLAQQDKQGIYYDKEIKEVNGILSKVKQEVVVDNEESDEEDLKNDSNKVVDAETFEEIAENFDEKILEASKSFIENLVSRQDRFLEIIRKEIGNDMDRLSEPVSDENFIEFHKLSEQKIDDLDSQLRKLENTEKTFKSQIKDKTEDSSMKKKLAKDSELTKMTWFKKTDVSGKTSRSHSFSDLVCSNHTWRLFMNLNEPKRNLLSSILLIQENAFSDFERHKIRTSNVSDDRGQLYYNLKSFFENDDVYLKRKEIKPELIKSQLKSINDSKLTNAFMEYQKIVEKQHLKDDIFTQRYKRLQTIINGEMKKIEAVLQK